VNSKEEAFVAITSKNSASGKDEKVLKYSYQVPGTTFSRMGRSVSGTEKLGGLRRYSPSAIRSRMSACFFRTALAC